MINRKIILNCMFGMIFGLPLGFLIAQTGNYIFGAIIFLGYLGTLINSQV